MKCFSQFIRSSKYYWSVLNNYYLYIWVLLSSRTGPYIWSSFRKQKKTNQCWPKDFENSNPIDFMVIWLKVFAFCWNFQFKIFPNLERFFILNSNYLTLIIYSMVNLIDTLNMIEMLKSTLQCCNLYQLYQNFRF